MAKFPADSYWVVGGDLTRFYSTAITGYLSASDPRYSSWLKHGNKPSFIGNEQDLWDYLNGRALNSTPANGLSTDAAKAARIDSQLVEVIYQIAFDQENRIRVLEKKVALVSRDEFLAYVKTLMK